MTRHPVVKHDATDYGWFGTAVYLVYVVLDAMFAVFAVQSNYYYYEIGRQSGRFFADVVCFFDFTWQMGIITPLKPWNKFGPIEIGNHP